MHKSRGTWTIFLVPVPVVRQLVQEAVVGCVVLERLMADLMRNDEGAVQLDLADGDRPVTISLENQDRILRTCQWAVEACKLGLGRDVVLRELGSLCLHIKKWAETNSSSITRCFASPRDNQVGIYVVPRSGRFDFGLSDRLTELDLELATKFQMVPCDVLQVPERDTDTMEFLRQSSLMISIYGDETTTPRTMAAQ